MRTVHTIPLAFTLVISACSSAPAPSPMGTAPAAMAAAPTVAEEKADRAAPRLSIDEDARVRDDRSRDPFQAEAVPPPTPTRDVRLRKSKHFRVDELQLVGVVTRTAEPRAVLVDPGGRGWIVAPGDLVGQPEVVHTAMSDRAASWRVDRIREREVVFVRDDAGTSGAAAATRVLAMRPEKSLSEDD